NGQTTGPITWSATAATLATNIQTGLAALTNVGAGNVSVTGTGPFTITFTTSVANPNMIAVSNNGLTPAGSTIALASGNQQIQQTWVVAIQNSGLLDLNGSSNTIGLAQPTALNLFGGSVTTGTGTLTLAGNVSSQVNTASQTPATISGNLSLGGTTRTIDVQLG